MSSDIDLGRVRLFLQLERAIDAIVWDARGFLTKMEAPTLPEGRLFADSATIAARLRSTEAAQVLRAGVTDAIKDSRAQLAAMGWFGRGIGSEPNWQRLYREAGQEPEPSADLAAEFRKRWMVSVPDHGETQPGAHRETPTTDSRQLDLFPPPSPYLADTPTGEGLRRELARKDEDHALRHELRKEGYDLDEDGFLIR